MNCASKFLLSSIAIIKKKILRKRIFCWREILDVGKENCTEIVQRVRECCNAGSYREIVRDFHKLTHTCVENLM